MIEQTMKWIKSGGGPLICVNENLAGFWRGTIASSRPNSQNEQTTDHNRACSTGDYVAEIETNGGRALILGDVPLETSVLSRRRTTIARLFYGDADANFVDIIDNISD